MSYKSAQKNLFVVFMSNFFLIGEGGGHFHFHFIFVKRFQIWSIKPWTYFHQKIINTIHIQHKPLQQSMKSLKQMIWKKLQSNHGHFINIQILEKHWVWIKNIAKTKFPWNPHTSILSCVTKSTLNTIKTI